MYWPNEPAHLYPDGQQLGGRKAFARMLDESTLSALDIFSFLRERATCASYGEFEDMAVARVRAFAPDMLYVQHLAGSDLQASLWQRIVAEVNQVSIIYHDDDPFDRFSKRIDAATRGILPHAQQVLLSGLGSLADLFRHHGAKSISYQPSCVSDLQFGMLDPSAADKQFDIVMIGNRGVRRKLKFLYLPGGRRRAHMAKRLSGLFGNRFALYGSGWSDLEASRGRIPYSEQEAALQSGRISVNWDHFDRISYYFSDRLPISLAAGVPHVTTWHEGYDQIFRDAPGFYACRSVGEAVETCQWLLSRSDDELRAEGKAAKAWVFANMEAVETFTRTMKRAIAQHNPGEALSASGHHGLGPISGSHAHFEGHADCVSGHVK